MHSHSFKYLLVTLLLFTFYTCIGQDKDKPEDNKYLVSVFDGDRFYDLFRFLESIGEVEQSQDSSLILSERKLIEDSVICGIYKFGIPGSHQLPYLYFVNSNLEKEFVSDYSVDLVLLELMDFFEKNSRCLKKEGKIEYMIKVGQFLKNRRLAELNRGHINVIEKD